jgi:glycosyltransferase involved in cell wall biosynthesis
MYLFMLSIVIPALNEEKYLPDCLLSLKNQDWHGEIEIIVVDNGSTDNTSAVAAGHGARVIACATRGVAYARQAGAEQARGDVIVQVDADTVYPRRWLGQIADHFAKHPDSAAVAGRYQYADPARWAPLEGVVRKLLNGAGNALFGRPLWVSGANFAFRRAAFERAKGYDPRSFQPDQWGIARRLSRFGRIAYDDKSVVTTSSRRVAKPAYIIGLEVIRNCARAGFYFGRHLAGQIRRPFRRQVAA